MWCLDKWRTEDYSALEQHLLSLEDSKYREFHCRLVPGIDDSLKIIGVRLPHLRKIAVEIAKGNAESFLADPHSNYYEEIMLQGLVIGKLKGDFTGIIGYIQAFVPKINNWAICDSFTASLHVVKKYPQEFYAFLNEYLHSRQEYELRFALTSLMNYYINEAYIDEVLKIYDGIEHQGYYVKMAVAWGLSVAYVKEKAKTMDYLENNNLDDWTYNKALQKIVESNRVGVEEKGIIRTMKRKPQK